VTLQSWTTATIGVAGLCFAIYAYIKNRKPRRLIYVVETDELLVPSTQHPDWGQLTVKIGDLELDQPRSAAIRITNTGKVEARLEDYDEPLRIVMLEGQNSAILAAAATLITPADGKRPPQVKNLDDVSGSGQDVTLPKVLLNERESIRIRLLIDGSDGELAVRGRLAGFKITNLQVETRNRGSARSRHGFELAVLGAASAVLVLAGTMFWVEFHPTHAVPDVRGLDAATAVNQLSEYEYRTQILRDFPSDKPAGTVIQQSPEAGSKRPPNSEVTILLSAGHQ